MATLFEMFPDILTTVERGEETDISNEMLLICVEEGYMSPRLINGHICAMKDMAYTRGICVGINELNVRRRYCYADPIDALEAFLLWKQGEPHPGGNWIKVKGQYMDMFIDELNPNLSKS